VVKKQYFLMRHGRSKANDAGLIISDPEAGCRDWGLTPEGEEQVRLSLEKSPLPVNCSIISSDFRRARETAELAASILQLPPPRLDMRLRERFFGDFEAKSNRHYQDIWDKDLLDENHHYRNVESPQQVMERGSDLIKELEQEEEAQSYLLVSHGDALQILLCWFQSVSPRMHRSLKHLETAEIRPIDL